VDPRPRPLAGLRLAADRVDHALGNLQSSPEHAQPGHYCPSCEVDDDRSNRSRIGQPGC